MLPLSDGLHARRFPVVTTALIAANAAVWLLYELPGMNTAIAHASFYPCAVEGTCQAPQPWWISWFTAMFMHASWSHILGNMIFLAVFGKNVEDAFGRLRFLAFYVAGGFAAAALQTAMTLGFGTDADARIPMLGASGAIAAVLGAFIVLYPGARITSLAFVFIVRIPAWFYLGAWFALQLLDAHAALVSPSAAGNGVAFFAHVGGFAFGAIVTWALLSARRVELDVPARQTVSGLA